MEHRYRDIQSNDGGRILLIKELRTTQTQYAEGTAAWTDLQRKIDQLVAENYLAYQTR